VRWQQLGRRRLWRLSLALLIAAVLPWPLASAGVGAGLMASGDGEAVGARPVALAPLQVDSPRPHPSPGQRGSAIRTTSGVGFAPVGPGPDVESPAVSPRPVAARLVLAPLTASRSPLTRTAAVVRDRSPPAVLL
jgi:hypothetical protein